MLTIDYEDSWISTSCKAKDRFQHLPLKSSTWLDILHWIRCLFQNFNYISIFNFQCHMVMIDRHRYHTHVRCHWKASYTGSELETGHWIMMLRGISHPAGKPVDFIRLSQQCNLSLFQLSQASHVKSSSNETGNAMTSRLELGSCGSVSIRRASSNVREHAWEDVCKGSIFELSGAVTDVGQKLLSLKKRIYTETINNLFFQYELGKDIRNTTFLTCC